MFEMFSAFAKFVLLPVAGAVIGALVKGRIEDRRLFKLRKTRNVSGSWRGFLRIRSERHERVLIVFETASFWNYRTWLNPRLVLGKAYVGKMDDRIQLRGGFSTEEYLMLDYKASEAHVHQFGCMLMRLDTSATFLEGDWLGYYDGPFVGRITLRKENA